MNKILLALILLLALTLRLYKLSSVPSALFADEASIGYNAYTIATSGIDEYGFKWPVFFRAFGEYKGPVQIYSTVLLVKLFGLNEASTRLVSVLWGVLSIVAIYFLAKEMWRENQFREHLALLSAAFLAIVPWHIHFSRIAFEPMSFVCLATVATWLFILGLRKPKSMIFSAFIWGLCLYTNFPARVFVPLFVFSLTVIYSKFWLSNFKIAFFSFMVGLLVAFPFILHILVGPGVERFRQVSIFAHPPQGQTIYSHIAFNYLSHFSWSYLFSKGDIDMPGQFVTRHSVRGMGELYVYQALFIVLGLAAVVKNKKWVGLFMTWLVVYPTGTMFTTDMSAQATRSTIGIIPFTLLTAVGVVSLWQLIKFVWLRRIISISLVIVGFLFLVKFFNLYFIQYVDYSSDFWGWQYGQKQIVAYFLQQAPYYDQLYSSGEANGAYIFYRYYDLGNVCVEKCLLGDVSTDSKLINKSKRQLFSVGADKINQSGITRILRIIYYPNGRPAFYIGEI